MNGKLSRTGTGNGLLTFAQRVEQKFPEAVGELAVILKTEIQHQLNTPGTGRYYAKVRSLADATGAKRKQLASFNRRLRNTAAALNRGALDRSAIKKSQVRSLHRASAPGAPPAPRTGDLRRSAFIEEVRGGFLVGVAMRYARWLEFGTLRMKPRPFMRPAARKVQQQTGVVLDRQMQDLARGST